jgi:hypothetical protein
MPLRNLSRFSVPHTCDVASATYELAKKSLSYKNNYNPSGSATWQ